MPVVSSIFLIIALFLAVTIGPQTRPWTWGPALLALAGSVGFAVPSLLKKNRQQGDFGFLGLGLFTVIWFGFRAWISPVSELGQADLLLLAAAVGGFVCVRSITGNEPAERVLAWGIALLLFASVVVVGKQLLDPSYSPIFRSRAADKMVSGFFAHYNEGANFLIAASMLVGAAALFGKHSMPTRIVWALIALAGLAGVWFTRSRGGLLGAAVASVAFFVMSMITVERRRSKWFVPALIFIPLFGLAVGSFVLRGWEAAQTARKAQVGIEKVMDNDSRLYFLGIAMTCIGNHPASGGGARSFSWECYQEADPKSNGDISHKPELVHNEFLQSATDYGLIGAGLLSLMLIVWGITAILRSMFDDRPATLDHRDAWRVGGLSALAGMLAQSNFSFIFHLLPGALLLGVCLGEISRSRFMERNAGTVATGTLLAFAGVAGCVFLIPAGWNGTRVTRILWSTYFSKHGETSVESRVDALTQAIGIWPQTSFYQDRATIFQTTAGTTVQPDFRKGMENALSDYQEAGRMNPYDPGPAVNQANVLSELHRDSEAEAAYQRAIGLQGGMEPAFRAHFSLATHYLRKSIRIFESEKPEPSLDALERSAEEMESAVQRMHWVLADMREPRVSIQESLGAAREAAGDTAGALECYDFAATLYGGRRAHYRAGVLIGNQAVDAWFKRRPSEAMTLFIESRKRILMAGNELPQGVTPSQRVEYLAYLDDKIKFLKGAHVQPTE